MIWIPIAILIGVALFGFAVLFWLIGTLISERRKIGSEPNIGWVPAARRAFRHLGAAASIHHIGAGG